MDITVKIEKFLPMQVLTSKKDGSEYHKYAFVAKTEEQYSKTICFTCIGDENWAKLNLQLGGTYSVSFNLSSREWQGRYYTEAECWRAVSLGSAPQPQPKPQTQTRTVQPQPIQPTRPQTDNDMPF